MAESRYLTYGSCFSAGENSVSFGMWNATTRIIGGVFEQIFYLIVPQQRPHDSSRHFSLRRACGGWAPLGNEFCCGTSAKGGEKGRCVLARSDRSCCAWRTKNMRHSFEECQIAFIASSGAGPEWAEPSLLLAHSRRRGCRTRVKTNEGRRGVRERAAASFKPFPSPECSGALSCTALVKLIIFGGGVGIAERPHPKHAGTDPLR